MKRTGGLSAAVLGAGLIGVDLADKILHSDVLDLGLVVGRDGANAGLRQAARLGMPIADRGISSIIEVDEPFDVVFDATNAVAHAEHAERLAPFDTMLVDLTPSRAGRMVVPTVNGASAAGLRDISMVTCGGQAAIPVLHAITAEHHVDYVEVVTTAATLSVGHGTRINLDEYVDTTQDAVRTFTGVGDVKAILNISPARPPATFRVAMSMLGSGFREDSVRDLAEGVAKELRGFVGGFVVSACSVQDERAFVAVEVTASGERLPRYAGNLDIINSAALSVAERCADDRRSIAEAEAS